MPRFDYLPVKSPTHCPHLNMKTLLILTTFISSLAAAETVTITHAADSWTLANAVLQAKVVFRDGKLSMPGLVNLATNRDYLAGRESQPFFTHTVAGIACPADDGKWTLGDARVSPIELYGKSWGKRLELTLTRADPVAFSVRQVFEIYDGDAGLRLFSFVGNGTDREVTIESSEILRLNLPDAPHTLSYLERIFTWKQTRAGLAKGGRNAFLRYDTGDGIFCAPENNWATSLSEGQHNGDPGEKFLVLNLFSPESQVPGLGVSTNPKAVRMTLYPKEEIEWFGVNIGVFSGDLWDARMAAANHFRNRFKFVNTAPQLSTNDWQWGQLSRKRTDANYRNIVIPKAAAAGFDRVHFDASWYTEDGTAAANQWTDMESLCETIVNSGMKPGHWFPLQGKGGDCKWCWYSGHGRDAANPANIDFKLKQTREDLIGRYHSAWGQLDCGLLWRTDKNTGFSHPDDSVYRKLLGMRRYVNAVTHANPDFLMQITCEIDNPGIGDCAQNTGLAHMGDNAILGTFNRAETQDDVRDLFASFGQFPMEASLSTPGEGGARQSSWVDSPLWFYQFLIARHASIYSWPGDWSDGSVARLRVFNDWRKSPRIRALLSEVMRPVYNGPDPVKNEGPWCWMFTDAAKSQALVFAINHLELNKVQSFDAKLRWLDAGKTYFIGEITQLPDGSCNYQYRGEFTGGQLIARGLPIDLDAGEERCAAFFVREKASNNPQVLYADPAILRYSEQASAGNLIATLEGAPGAVSTMSVCKPGANGIEERRITLDAAGHATATFDSTTITQPAGLGTAATLTTDKAIRDTTTAGAWHGKFGLLAAWIAGNPVTSENGFSLTCAAPVHVWGDAPGVPRVLAQPANVARPNVAACWTTTDKFSLRINAPPGRPYKLSVYLMDYDNGKRGMDLIVRSKDGTLRDRQSATVAEMGGGIYLSWNVTGPVTVQVMKMAGCNAAVSGVFVDEAR